MPFRDVLHRLMSFLSLCFMTASLLAFPAAVQAESFVVRENEAEVLFPEGLSFILVAESDEKIVRVSLYYGVQSNSCIESQARRDMDYTPGKRVNLRWTWDLYESGGLPVGVEAWWQWEVEDEDGNITRTDLQRIRVEDPFFEWKKLEKEPITLLWAEGSEDFGRKLLNISTRSLDRLASNAGLELKTPIQIVIYPSAEDMRRAMVAVTEWAGGVAYPEYHVILIGIPTDSGSWADEVIPHELAHLVTETRISNCGGSDMPTWLGEGLSMYAEGPVPEDTRRLMERALEAGTLPRLRSLAEGFSADSVEANEAYQQSQMVVTYLIETYGSEKLNELFDAIQTGQPVDRALKSVYGWDTDGLDQDWRASLGYGEVPLPDFSTATARPAHSPVPTLAVMTPAGAFTATPSLTPVLPTATATPLPTATVLPTGTATAVSSRTISRFQIAGLVCVAGAAVVTGSVIVLLFILKKR